VEAEAVAGVAPGAAVAGVAPGAAAGRRGLLRGSRRSTSAGQQARRQRLTLALAPALAPAPTLALAPAPVLALAPALALALTLTLALTPSQTSGADWRGVSAGRVPQGTGRCRRVGRLAGAPNPGSSQP